MRLSRMMVLGASLVISLVTTSGAASEAKIPVVVELFTSEGCSSCPPADQLLARLTVRQPLPGVEVIALSEHVDYWNRLGWKDPFSSPVFSRRQEQYVQVLGGMGPYTPQIVVDGRTESVGNDATRACSAIGEAVRSAKVAVQLTLLHQEWTANLPKTVISVRVSGLPQSKRGEGADVMLAVTEDNLASQVSCGENAGRTLSHAGVVRTLTIAGKADLAKPEAFAGEATLQIDPHWKLENLRTVAFVQERSTRRILGAATLRLTP